MLSSSGEPNVSINESGLSDRQALLQDEDDVLKLIWSIRWANWKLCLFDPLYVMEKLSVIMTAIKRRILR